MDFSINKINLKEGISFKGLEGAYNAKTVPVFRFYAPAHRQDETVYLEFFPLDKDETTSQFKDPKKFYTLGFSKKDVVELPQDMVRQTGAGFGYRYKIVDENQKVRDELQRLITMLGIQFGELNIEILLDECGNVHFLELGPRAGGNMIPLQLSDAFGVDLVKANVLAAMGVNPQLTPHEQPGCFMTYVLHSCEEGKFNGIRYSNELKPHIYREVVYKKEGDQVDKFDGAGKALGIVFLHFDEERQMNEYCDRMEELIKIDLE